MRGSNITLYRFFEDGECGRLPWDEKWVRLLHQRVKDMHWNCLRYCIGFPPEAWYDIADEAGILIDDEFPIWFGGDVPKEMRSDELAKKVIVHGVLTLVMPTGTPRQRADNHYLEQGDLACQAPPPKNFPEFLRSAGRQLVLIGWPGRRIFPHYETAGTEVRFRI